MSDQEILGRVQRRLLAPLVIIMLVTVGGFVGVTYLLQDTYLRQSNRELLTISTEVVQREIERQTALLSTLSIEFMNDAELATMLREERREQLLTSHKPYFERAQTVWSISHYYLHRPDGTVLLRLHQPDFRDDLIQRHTMTEAIRSKQSSSGLELGPLGTYTLRMVIPVEDELGLAGFLELGIEMSRIVSSVITRPDVEVIMTVYKSFLEREQWEAGMRRLGRESYWDAFPDEVIIYSSISMESIGEAVDISESRQMSLDDDSNTPTGTVRELGDDEGERWTTALSPLIDAAGRTVGGITLVKKISATEAAWYQSLRYIALISGLFIVAVMLFINRLLVRTDRGITRQASELQRMSRLLNNVINTSSDLIFVKDMELRLILCNEALAAVVHSTPEILYGKTDAESAGLVGSLAEDANEWIEAMERTDRAVLDSEQPLSTEIFSVIDGKRHIYETVKSPLRDESGKMIGLVGVARDITDRRKTEANLRQKQKMEAVGKLTGGIAHDFNNILAIILGNMELLELELAEHDDARALVETIEKTAERGARLTKQLLSFSRRSVREQSETRINEVIGELEGLIRGAITPQVEVVQNFTADLWTTTIDGGEFQDALLNLIINARDAMKGSGVVRLETRNRTADEEFCSRHVDADPGDYIEISVIDNGPGIEPEVMENIFEPFFTTKELGRGTGLGLSMVYGFVKRSQGFISVDTEIGIGTKITIFLPRSTEGDTLQPAPEVTSVADPRGTETILLVDDELALLDASAQMLRSMGYRVLTANTGMEAIAVMEDSAGVDLLLSDIVMPGPVNGYALAEHFATDYPGVAVLMMSGYAESSALSETQRQLMNNMLAKPFTMLELSTRVRTMLDSRNPITPDQSSHAGAPDQRS